MQHSATPWRAFDAPGTQAGSDEDGDASGPAGSGNSRPFPKPDGARGMPVSPGAIAGLGAAAIVGVIAIVIAVAGSRGQVVDGPDRSAVEAGGAALLVGGDVVVDVTGAVARPGLYRLAAGSRVGDAIEAAGGFGPRVDAGRVARDLNLAALLVDGSQVHVPSRGEAGPAGADSGGPSGAGGAGADLINLNVATQAELESLPGIGPVTATKIIESRAGSRFTSVDELRERGLVGEKTFQQLRSLVSVD
jgi:competence protein ComEA